MKLSLLPISFLGASKKPEISIDQIWEFLWSLLKKP